MADLIELNQGGTLNASWERSGAAYDPGVVTVAVTRDDGTSVASGAASGTGTGGRTFALTPAQCNQLDHLTVTWTAADGSVLTTYAEVVGGFLFSVQLARTRSPLQDDVTYSTSAIVYYRALAEQALEDICGVAFVPRYTREQVYISNRGLLTASRRRIRTVRQITVWNGTQDSPLSNLTGLQIVASDQVFFPAAWNWYALPIKMAYEHGYNEAPLRVSRACLELARRWLIESPWDERMTGFRSREGGSMQILTASNSNPFDIPEVVAVANAYGTPMM